MKYWSLQTSQAVIYERKTSVDVTVMPMKEYVGRFVICLLVDTLMSASRSLDVCTGDPTSKYYPVIINCDFVTIRLETDQVVTSVYSFLPISPFPGFGKYFLNERFLYLRLFSLFAVSILVTIDSIYQISHPLLKFVNMYALHKHF